MQLQHDVIFIVPVIGFGGITFIDRHRIMRSQGSLKLLLSILQNFGICEQNPQYLNCIAYVVDMYYPYGVTDFVTFSAVVFVGGFLSPILAFNNH